MVKNFMNSLKGKAIMVVALSVAMAVIAQIIAFTVSMELSIKKAEKNGVEKIKMQSEENGYRELGIVANEINSKISEYKSLINAESEYIKNIASYTDDNIFQVLRAGAVMQGIRGIQYISTYGKEVWYLNKISSKNKQEIEKLFSSNDLDYNSGVYLKDNKDLMITLAKKVTDKDNKVIGILVMDIDDKFVQDMAGMVKVGTTDYTFVVDNNGVVLTHPKAELVGKILPVESLANVVISNRGNYTKTVKYTFDGVSKTALIQGVESINGVLITAIQNEDILSIVKSILNIFVTEINKIGLTMMFIGVLNIVVVGFIAAFAVNKMFNPMLNVIKNVDEMSKGNLKADLQLDRGSIEIINLVNAINRLKLSLTSMITDIKNTSERVDVESYNVERHIKDLQESYEAVNTAVSEIAKGAMIQAESAETTSHIFNELNESFDELKTVNKSLVQITLESQKVSSGANELMHSLGSKIVDIIKKSEKTQENIETLVNSINKVINGVKVINEINEQTNLLSLNASIEASHAGEHGKGFAVVAHAIRDLAKQTKSSAEAIELSIKEIQKAVADVTTNTEGLLDTIKLQAGASQETTKAFDMVVESNNNIIKSIEVIGAVIDKISNGKDKVIDAMQSIVAVSEQTAASTEEVSASVDTQNRDLRSINSEINGLNSELILLKDKLNKFKLE